MKQLSYALILAGMFSGSGLVVAAETSPHTVTGNLNFVTDYRFRGISQTFEDPAIQGGFDYAHSSGFYLGTWASNVEEAELSGSNMEWDVYGGYTFNVGPVAVNVGGLYYWYPGKDERYYDFDGDGVGDSGFDPNTFEVYVGATWKWLNVKYSHTTTKLFGFSDSEGSGYLEANATFALPMDITLGLHVAKQFVAGDIAPGVAHDDYMDWKIGITKPILGFNVGLAYVDTDIEANNVTWGYNTAFAKGSQTEDLADGTVVLSIGKTF